MTNAIELRDCKKALELERQEVQKLNGMLDEKQHGLETTVDEVIALKKAIELLQEELADQRKAAANTSVSHNNETQGLVKTITDEREDFKRMNLKLHGFKDGVKFVLQNLPTQLGSRDDY